MIVVSLAMFGNKSISFDLCIDYNLHKNSFSSGLFDLKTKTDVLMFNGEELHLISTEGGRFTMIMANFSYYERMVGQYQSVLISLLREL